MIAKTYSMIAPVPPLTVRIPATFRIISVTIFSIESSKICAKQKRTLGRSPARELASKLDTNNLGGLKLPGEVGHNIDGISTTDTNGGHTETTSVGSVRVSSDHETTREGVVLEDDLVNDTRAGSPETDVVLGASSGQEVVNLLVDVLGTGKILLATNLGLNQVITVDGGRGSD